jgi:asparagine synthase (glutamine-hydrolysing)
MTTQLQHRGPDGAGYYSDEQAALGHRRLSIIDLAGGSQPLGNEDGTIQVVFNGEIYNFLELRGELAARGHRFSTHSDTEVLVHLYEDVGERLPEYLNGMFAFAIWDGRRQELFLARDRFGKKPLYYSFDIPGLRFWFASELKALWVHPEFDREIEPASLLEYLAHDYIADPATIYKGVYKLEPGHSLHLTRTGSRKRQYWQPRYEIDGSRKFEDTVEEIRALAADCVRARMISDVPLGAFLSGGVDSSGVVAWMAQQAPERVKTFSIGFTSKALNELEFAHLVVERYRTDHHELTVTPSIQEMIGKLVDHYDEPFADSSAIPMLYLARMTRQHVTVALCGDGADELFGGYRRYYYGVLEEKLRRVFPHWFRRSAIRMAGRYYPKFDYLPQVFRAKTLLNNLACDLGDAYFTSVSGFKDDRLEAILSPDLRRAAAAYSPREIFRRRFQSFQHLPPLEQMMAVDLETYLPGDILTKADRATMAYSLESRSPWLDYRLAESSPFGCRARGRCTD